MRDHSNKHSVELIHLFAGAETARFRPGNKSEFMKSINKLFYCLFLLTVTLFWACDPEGIDPITPVDAGPDQTAPVVEISFPANGSVIQVLEVVTTVNVQFEVIDDIEIANISVLLDGNEIAAFSEFLDYRRYVAEFTYDEVGDGSHILKVVATDVSGKVTEAEVEFTKEPAYVPLYDGEVLYMPFDGDYIDLVNIERPTKVGNPGFAGEGFVGLDAYKGNTNSYLTYPTANLNLTSEFTAVFWMKVNATPDRAGILVIGPPDAANPEAQNNRTQGFRFFRENAGGMQRFKLNAGTGAGDAWFDGGANADVDSTVDQWHHFAFTITGTKNTVYIDGNVVSEGAFAGIDWSDTDVLSIMSGAPRFTGWNHLSDESLMDELRIFNRELSGTEIQDIITAESGIVGYEPKYPGETFYLGFDDEYLEKNSNREATVVGNPGFAGTSQVGSNAYAGAEGSYLTFPTTGLTGENFSAAFWLNVNAVPDRAGILVAGPEDTANPEAQNVRTSGFRFFRENAAGMQRFKLNVGNGDGENWFDGGMAADVDPTTGWHHFAFTISGTQAIVYIDGEEVAQGDFPGINWDGCDLLSIMSGAPRFAGWNHLSDQSYMDELRLFNTTLTKAEIAGIIADEM